MMTMTKTITRPSIILAALSLVLSSHPCACTELYGNRIHAEFRDYCLLDDSEYLGVSVQGLFYECGDPAGRCICQDHTAYCDVFSPALPVLPDDVHVLDLCNDYFIDVDSLSHVQLSPQFFRHMNKVTELRISNVDFTPEAFDLLANITNVTVSCQYTSSIRNEKLWWDFVLIPSLRSFTSSRCDWIPPSSHPGTQSPLQSFTASTCAWIILDFTVFTFFKDLKRISINKGNIEQVDPAALPALEELVLDDNELTSFPQICDMHNNSFFPSLKRISLSHNKISFITFCSRDQAQPAVLQALEELILDNNILTSFPQTCDMHNKSFFPSLKKISLLNNRISQIGGKGSATCLPQVTEIEIGGAYEFSIKKGVFDAQSCPKLETINISHEDGVPVYIHTEDFIFSNPSIKTLNLNYSGWNFGPCTKEHCVAQNTFANSSLTHLILERNDFNDVDFDRFFALFGDLRNLTHLSLEGSHFREYARFCLRITICQLNLQYLSLSYSSLQCGLVVVGDKPCHNTIKTFKADKVVSGEMGSESCFLGLKLFLLRYALGGSDIEHISFRDNSIDFGHVCSFEDHCVLPVSFENKPHLTVLLLDGNDFSNVGAERFDSLFGKLTNLKNLSLSNCGIKCVSAEMLHSFPRLQYLDLSNNRINTLSIQTFSALPSLNVLYLDGNVLSVVPEGLFSSDQRKGMTKFTLYQNVLVCSCDIRWLQSWLLSDPDLFDYSFDQDLFDDYSVPEDKRQSYICFDDPTKSIANYTMPDQACMLGQEAAIAIIITSTLTIAALTVFSLLFRYRWNFRLLLYYALSGRPNYQGRRRNYVYDVFVSYDKEDFEWIRQQLMPQLEDRMGLRVCIHQRDFIPGHYIVTNITQAVEHSKKVLMVFSRHFVLSRWCQFEVDFCLSHAIENRDSLLIVCLDDVASDDTLLTGAMKAALSTMTYIQWVNRRDAIHFFWERVRQSLGDVRPRDREAGRRRLREVLDPDARVRIEIQVMDF